MKAKIILVASTAFIGACGFAATHAQQSTSGLPVPALPAAPRPANSPIEGYRHWVKVNATPHMVASNLALLCRAPTQQELAEDAANPHLDPNKKGSLLRTRFVTVYANSIAEHAILHEKTPHFAVGSCIVKERLASARSTSPELITVMQKREAGYNPSGGDWEYRVMDGAGKVVQADGKLQFCEGCHSKWKGAGYVSRAYLKADELARLR